MTKQNFIDLADQIKWHNSNAGILKMQTFTPEQINALAEFCARQNPRFDRSRWLGYIAGTNGKNGGKCR